MKKILFIILCISGLIFAIHEIYASKQPDNVTNVDYVIEKTIQQHEECSHLLDTKTFINYDVLRLGINDDWNIVYNIIASWRWYHIDERGNISSDCSFASIPIVMEIIEDEKWYTVNTYRSETNESDYTKFVKDNFSSDGYIAWQTRQRNNISKKIDTLSMAEKYFWIKLYENKYFDCPFCDTAWYYYDTIKNKTWEVRDLYGIEPLNDKYVIFNSDWTAQTFWTKDAWEFKWFFGKNASTLILKNDKTEQTMERLIIDDLKSREMTFFTETIEVYQ